MRGVARAAIGAGLAVVLTGPASAGDIVLPDREARLAAHSRIEALRRNLDANPSATAVLRAWCREHGLAAEPDIRAVADRGAQKPLRPEDRLALGVQPGEAIGYRRVRLTCGERVLSEADNWYRPAELTPQMVQTLDTTDTPFGVVVAPLKFQRRTLSSRLLFEPLAAPDPDAAMTAPSHVLEQRAVLYRPDGPPFSLVVESYTAQILAGIGEASASE